MNYNTSFLNVNDVWREILIVSNDTATTFDMNRPITFTMSANTEQIFYHTGETYKEFVENGKYIYWFIIVSREVKTNMVTTQQLDKLTSSLEITQAVVDELMFGGKL